MKYSASLQWKHLKWKCRSLVIKLQYLRHILASLVSDLNPETLFSAPKVSGNGRPSEGFTHAIIIVSYCVVDIPQKDILLSGATHTQAQCPSQHC